MTETIDRVSTLVRYCGAPTREGGTCRQVVGLDSESGPFHDPARTPPLGARGGARTGDAGEYPPGHVPPPAPPETLDDVVVWHSWITGALARGQIDKATCTGLSYNLQQLRGALVSRDLEREVLRLREALAALKRGQQSGGTR